MIRCKTALVMRCCAAVALLGLGGGQGHGKRIHGQKTGEAERAWAEHGLGLLIWCVYWIAGDEQDGEINMQVGVSSAN